MDSFAQNIYGVQNLIESSENKTRTGDMSGEGVLGEYVDILELPMSDEELLKLRDEWEGQSNKYLPKVEARQNKNKLYYQGKQRASANQRDKVVSSNVMFEAEETFIPQALSQNPEPTVWSDNSDEGKQESNELKTMLQYHAEVLQLRRKLGVMVRHWSIYFIGVMKYGWDDKVNDIKVDVRNPKNFILDPDGYIDESGSFVGRFVGERIESTAESLIELFPKHKAYITLRVDGKLGTQVVRTEWWTDDYCFTTFQDEVLDKHKNEYFNYPTKEEGEDDGEGYATQTATPGINHFAVPKMPYTFLSVFSLQERPHDITSLIEQNIPNQDRVNDRDDQIAKNLASANNSVVLSGTSFTIETAGQARDTFYEEGFLLVPDGNVDKAVKRLPANEIPQSVFKAQENDIQRLQSIFGTYGVSSQKQTEDTTARGQILNQQHDTSRIGGGIGDALEQVAKNAFNWFTQLYCVFYDEPHYGAVIGNAGAIDYVSLMNSHMNRHFVISVTPDSMQPKDEITERNLAMQRWDNKSIDPINLLKALNDPDPLANAKMLVMWTTNPQAYAATFFPEVAGTMGGNNPQGGTEPGQPADIQEQAPGTLAATPANASLSQVPINAGASQPSVPPQV